MALLNRFLGFCLGEWRSLLGAIVFYTIIPIPINWQPNLERIARWLPFVGLLLGGLLLLIDYGLGLLQTPTLLRSAILVILWLKFTGGLHLDGAMDTADGLAVTDPERRLLVMADSVTGAFGVMEAIAILLLKTAALTELTANKSLALLLALCWGRWGQIAAIALYPYLKPQGKGAFHKNTFQYPQDLLIPTLLLTSLNLLLPLPISIKSLLLTVNLLIPMLISHLYHKKLGGHTGDTYGATIEWSETLILCLTSIILNLTQSA